MSLSEFEAIFNQIQEARAERLDIDRIRVSPYAIEGTIVVVPYTPERLRTEGELIALPNGTVDAHPDSRGNYRKREILIHPEDWIRILQTSPTETYSPTRLPDITPSVFGIPVVRDLPI